MLGQLPFSILGCGCERDRPYQFANSNETLTVERRSSWYTTLLSIGRALRGNCTPSRLRFLRRSHGEAKHPLYSNEQQEEQMKTNMYLLIVATMGAAASGCGGAGDGRQDGQASSSLLTTRVAVKQADGSWKRSTYSLTREQRKAEGDARLERDRQRRAGVQTQALTSEIELTECSNWASTWIHEWTR